MIVERNFLTSCAHQSPFLFSELQLLFVSSDSRCYWL